MVGKRSGKALLREEGLERTDNNMDLTTWPQINMINQKNYYTEYLKRDDQILPLRLLQEERRNRMTAKAKDRDRYLAQTSINDAPQSGADIDMNDDVDMEDPGELLTGQDALGSKVIVIHPGSQNLRIGLASDALPKTVPMVIARRWKISEAFGQDTRKYTFKTYDEVLLAPQGYFQPTIFDHSQKLNGRHTLIGRSYDIYEGGPNDPVSSAQSAVISLISPLGPAAAPANGETANGHSTPAAAKQTSNLFQKVNDFDRVTPSAVGSPAPEDDDNPMLVGDASTAPNVLATSLRDDVLPVISLDTAILTSIAHGARGDERRTRDFLMSVMVIGGGAQIPGFYSFLEEKLKELRPGNAKDITIGTPPRELDPQGVIWKGGSVFGKLRGTNDSWIGRMEYDRLGARLLAYKCMWAW
ncbi:actin-related protein 8, partial [Lecanoromycetidae sp. Uapishka_2]